MPSIDVTETLSYEMVVLRGKAYYCFFTKQQGPVSEALKYKMMDRQRAGLLVLLYKLGLK